MGVIEIRHLCNKRPPALPRENTVHDNPISLRKTGDVMKTRVDRRVLITVPKCYANTSLHKYYRLESGAKNVLIKQAIFIFGTG